MPELGLGSVELVLSVEDRFGVQFRDEDLSRTATVGELHSLLLRAMSEAGHPVDAPGAIYNELRDLIASHAGVPADQVREQSHIVKDLGVD